MGISIFLLFWNPGARGEVEKPTEERPAFELPEVVIIGEDQSKVIIGGEWKPLIDQPFLKKVEVGLESAGKLSPLLFPPQRKDLNITEVNFAYGNFNSLKSNLTHGRQIKDKAHYLFSIGKYKTDGEFSGRRYNQDSAFLEIGFKPAKKLELKIATSGLFKDYRLSNSTDTQKVDLFNLELGLERKIGEETSVGGQFFGQEAHLKNGGKAKGDIGGAGLQARIGLAQRNTLNIEAQLYQERISLSGNRRRYLVSFISLTDEFLIFDKLGIHLGMEYKEKSKPFTSFIYPTGRLSYEVIPNFNIWVKYKPELEIPVFNELYIDNDYVGVNLDLLPQKKIFSLEEGMDYKFNQNLSSNISFFQKKFRNFITLSDDGRIGNLENTPNIYSQGIEASFVYSQGVADFSLREGVADFSLREGVADFNLREGVADFNLREGVADFSLRLKYVYERIENEDQPDEKVPYKPSHSLKISSHYGYGPLGIELTILMQSERYYNRSYSLPFYLTLGTEISYSIIEQFLFFLQGENLLQEKYAERFGYPLDHSKFLGGFKVKW